VISTSVLRYLLTERR